VNRFLYIALALIPFAAPVEAGLIENLQQIFKNQAQTASKLIKVLIAHDEPGVILETKGKYSVYDPLTNQHLLTRTAGKRKFVQPTAEGLRWGEEFPSYHQLKFVPESPQGTIIVESLEYKGVVYVYNIHDKIFVVNELDIEDYLQSILTSEFKEPLSNEALAAIVIAERTNALYQALNPKTKFWAVDAEQVGYMGYAVTAVQKKIEEVVKCTHNMVLSRTAAYEGVVTPFPAHLTEASKEGVSSKISVRDIYALAESGEQASQILLKAFPETSIQLVN
jgi:Stage II sporulation protein